MGLLLLPTLIAIPLLLHPSHVASQSFQASKLQSECGILYTVVSGDGCWSISGAAHITQAQLAALNPDLDCATLQVGQGLCLGLPCAKTYEVASGDWCAKVQQEQGISEADLFALNPGFNCNEIFAGQRLCVAKPTTTVPPDPGPTPIPPPIGSPAPSPPCGSKVQIYLGDTCYDIATYYGLQLGQFTALNPNLNCTVLGPGTSACVQPPCGDFYRVQSGDWCTKIEGDHGLASGQLVKLNPSLNCDQLAPNQLVCVQPPPEAGEPTPPTASSQPWDEFPPLAPGADIPLSPLLSYADSDNPYDSFFGQAVFQQDTQHHSIFGIADRDGDGKLSSSELQEMMQVHPIVTRGLANRDDKLSRANSVQYMLKNADKDGDGFISQAEYMGAVYEVQNATDTLAEIALRRRSGELSVADKRFIDLLIYGAIALLLMAAVTLGIMRQLEEEALKGAKSGAAEVLPYLDVIFLDKDKKPPACSAYIYYSDNCGTWWSSEASKCSKGGKKVFEESCQGPLTQGAKACGFGNLGCSSMCWNFNTDNCDCDALNYTAETKTVYQDPAIETSTVTGNSFCRKKCTSTSGCIGYSVELKENSSKGEATCRTYKTMTSPKKNENATSFRSSADKTTGICAAPPPGYYPISADQSRKAGELGETLANKYADEYALARRSGEDTLPDSYDPRPKFTTIEEYNQILKARDLPTGTDLRNNPLIRKNQAQTNMCVSFSLSSTVEGTVKKAFGRTTNNELSPTWLHRCIHELDKKSGTKAEVLLRKVGTDYLATESCIPFSTVDNPKCSGNGCGASGYGKLPYISTWVRFESATGTGSPKKAWDRIKQHLIDHGPVTNAFSLSEAFNVYARTLSSLNNEEVFYYNHPSYKNHECTAGGHQMTIVGYGHYKRSGDKKQKLYWIVQNSWGITSGKNGYVFIAAGALESGSQDGYGIKVKEGSPIKSDLPLPRVHDEV